MKLCPRRPGDATAVYASTEKARRELGWKYVKSLFFYAVQFDTIHQINLLMYFLYSFFMFCKFDVFQGEIRSGGDVQGPMEVGSKQSMGLRLPVQALTNSICVYMRSTQK